MEDDALGMPAIPVGLQRMSAVGGLVAAYRRMADPVLIAERVWIERRADDFVLHLGRPVAQERTTDS